jgi:hypothetical protein
MSTPKVAEHPIPAAVREHPAYQAVMSRLRARVAAAVLAERPATGEADEHESAA